MNLVGSVRKCNWCNGEGKYEQTYNAGCGRGSYRSVGPCDRCAHPSLFMEGLGYVDAKTGWGKDIPLSVINQIKELNK